MNEDYMLDYKQMIDAGEVIAGEKIRQKVHQHFLDREKSSNEKYPYFYDNEQANNYIRFISAMPDPDGLYDHVQLYPFQKAILCDIFGWRQKSNPDFFRWRKLFLSMARKNGKTMIDAYICIAFLYLFRGKKNFEMYFASNSAEQADKGFTDLKNFLSEFLDVFADDEVALTTKIKKDIIVKNNNGGGQSSIKKLPKTTRSIEGKAPSLFIYDESHMDPDGKMIDSALKGMDKYQLVIQSSTAGEDLSYPFYHEYQYIAKILSGEVEEADYCIWDFEQDSYDEINRPETWEKSNPILFKGASSAAKIKMNQLLSDRTEAFAKHTESSFITKYMNNWYARSASQFILPKLWQKNTIARPNNLRDVYVGIDLSIDNDLSSVSFLFPFLDQEQTPLFYADDHSFVATSNYSLERKSELDHLDYDSLSRKGFVSKSQKHRNVVEKTQNGDEFRYKNVIDYEQIADYIMNYVKSNHLNVLGVGYDEAKADVLINILLAETDWDLTPISQTAASMSQDTLDFKDDVISGKLLHADNPTLENSIINANIVVVSDNYVKVAKPRNSAKIDPLYALLDAYTIAKNYWLDQEQQKKSFEALLSAWS